MSERLWLRDRSTASISGLFYMACSIGRSEDVYSERRFRDRVGWFRHLQLYSGLTADTVMESIALIDSKLSSLG